MIEELLKNTQTASRTLAKIDPHIINQLLLNLADALVANKDLLLQENRKDLERMSPKNPKYDRLALSPDRIDSIANDLRNVASLESPIGEVMQQSTRPNGIIIKKVRVPIGVVGVIYEARPNVTFDVFSLCFKTGNACVLKGGSDAAYSNAAGVRLIQQQLQSMDLPSECLCLLPNDREATSELLQAVDYVDLIIPRGSKQLIDFVRDHSKVPVIETGAGICHTYVDAECNTTMAEEIVFNAKTRRVSVCNALDCLIIHRDRLHDLPQLTRRLAEKNVVIYADERSYQALEAHYPSTLLQAASPEHFGTEFLDYKLSIKTVDSIEEALEHIHRFSSKHSEAIVSTNNEHISLFQQSVDAACVYANVSTAFTDGAQFGFGAEIGISTQKMHARGPMALPELTTYKYLIEGNGQTRW